VSADVHGLTLLTVRETAALLRQSERSVRRKVHSGQIPAVRLGDGGGPLRIPADELKAWLYKEPARGVAPSRARAVPAERRGPDDLRRQSSRRRTRGLTRESDESR
jgi:excisionase family DNA binding protein